MKKLLFCILMVFNNSVFAMEDDLQKAIEIAKSGNKFQTERLKIAAENLANEKTVGMEPGEDPYRRKTIYAENRFDKNKKTRLVKVKKISRDQKAKFQMRYEPNHPAADERGIVKYPNIDRMIEKTDALEAQKSYEAGISMIDTSKSMINKTIDILK